jgi:hypothetical protein
MPLSHSLDFSDSVPNAVKTCIVSWLGQHTPQDLSEFTLFLLETHISNQVGNICDGKLTLGFKQGQCRNTISFIYSSR